MPTAARRQGDLLLILAQIWSALCGLIVLLAVAGELGQDEFGGFALIIWTLTALEALLVEGVPRAVSAQLSRHPSAARRLVRFGLQATALVALGLAALLALGAPQLGRLWRDSGLVLAVRIAAVNFLALAGFAVMVQALNGLRYSGRRAAVWLCYSTAKVVAVLGALRLGHGLEGAVMGYVTASFVGSAGAVLIGGRAVARTRGHATTVPGPWHLWTHGQPLAMQNVLLLALLVVDLWAAKRFSGSASVLGAYAAAAMLARILFFVFRALGEALSPSVARLTARGAIPEARQATHDLLASLGCLLLPATGLATGSAVSVLSRLFGDSNFAAGAPFLRWLAPAASAWAFAAVLALVVSTVAQPRRVVVSLLFLLALEAVLVFLWAEALGPRGAAMGALVAGLLGVLGLGLMACRTLGSIVPWRALVPAALAGLILDRAMTLWAPPSWWVFLYGALLYALAVKALSLGGVLVGGGHRRERVG